MIPNIIIGKIVGVHGVRGEVKVQPLTDDPNRFSDVKKAMLLSPNEKVIREISVSKVRITENQLIVAVDLLTDRDEAKKWINHFVAVERSQAVELPEGRYFINDLIGLWVEDDERGKLGTIRDIISASGAGADVIVIARVGCKDLLVPYLKSIVYDVDTTLGVMRLRLPDGLFEIYQEDV
ncbi:MAG TPA: 16S rRNA processing protein RimM [Clostridiaceae bacterium]|jgi:16S rRNA processing protein RimM|nr:16S rRNA processing protein RimM [Clostridiaceae bacterium]